VGFATATNNLLHKSDTNIAIRFGFSIIVGDVLETPTHDVFSYNHGGMTECRGRPADFYEFIHNEPVAGITVQELSNRLDAGAIVATSHCNIEECKSLAEVREYLFASP